MLNQPRGSLPDASRQPPPANPFSKLLNNLGLGRAEGVSGKRAEEQNPARVAP